ncbi:MAG TPA: hypothetical protein VFD51_02565 [Patescibacteria group bacterium]|nr:hypothetical protein [Patescibacteria group bacterium]
MKQLTKVLLIIFISLITLTLIFFAINSLFKSEEVKVSDKEINKVSQEKLFTVSGEFVCLPVKDENKAQNNLCAFGIKNNDGYYRLQSVSDDKFNVIAKLDKGQKIEISGVLINEVSNIYTTLGTIEVNSVTVLDIQNDIESSGLPSSFKAEYISFQNYSSGIFKAENYPPAEFKVLNGEIECEETGLGSSLPLRISKKEINGNKYCIGAFSEGAAGSVYTEYAYSTVIGDNVYLILFVARYTNCDNYPEEENLKCKTERENFDLDVLVDQEVERMRV